MTKVQVPDLLLYCPSSFGGIPDYAHYQAEALGQCGWKVRMLCQPDYPHQAEHYEQDPCLPGAKERGNSKLKRAARLFRDMLKGYAILAAKTRDLGYRQVLLASYGEYLAPLWAWRFRKLRKKGVRFGAVIHDPVRDFVLGPKRWHRWSVSECYSFIDDGFVHEAIELDTGSRKYSVRQTVIPHGPYPFPDPSRARAEVREGLDIPQDAKLFLCFGHLRDGKNLNLILEAMQEVPDAWVLIAGTEAGTGHTTSADYQKQAERLGVASRCRWIIGFASPEEAADYFEAADFALLTYEARFRSASGVLNVATRYRRPVVASCGESNLASAVVKYDLGVRVKPDSAPEITKGMQQLLESPPAANWEGYEQDNSWIANARLVIEAFEKTESEEK